MLNAWGMLRARRGLCPLSGKFGNFLPGNVHFGAFVCAFEQH